MFRIYERKSNVSEHNDVNLKHEMSDARVTIVETKTLDINTGK